MKKKILSLSLAIGIISLAVVAQSGSGVNSPSWRIGNDTLYIEGSGAMTNYTQTQAKGDAPWYDNRNDIVAVMMGDGVTSIGNFAFYKCVNLTSVTIGDGVTNIGNMAFLNCEGIASISIPNNVTSIGEMAFFNCGSLTAIDVSSDNTVYASENGVLFDKAKKRLIRYPEGKPDVTYTVSDGVTSIEQGSFACCKKLSAIHVSGNNTAYVSENGVLFDKTKTRLIHYPAGRPSKNYTVAGTVRRIESFAFFACRNLASVTIENGVTSIGGEAFLDCSGLTGIYIPESVTSIGELAFYCCNSLTTVINLNPTPQKTDPLLFSLDVIIKATLYVPAKSVKDYRKATSWEYFGKIRSFRN